MKLFETTDDEKRLLRERLEYLSLLDLESGQHVPIVQAQPRDALDHSSHIEQLWLTESFAIGSCIPHLNRPKDTLGPLIEKIIVSIYERSWLNHIMATINEPLSLELDSRDYYNGIAQSIVEASFARVAVLHLLEEDKFEAGGDKYSVLGIHDRLSLLTSFAGEISLPEGSEWFSRLSKNEDGDHEIVRIGGNQDHEQEILNYLLDNDLKTLFVLPLRLGGIHRGFLAIAFDVDLHLSETLKLTFHGMANHAVAAAENFRKLQALDKLRNDLLRDHLTAIQVELLQGFRHVAGNANDKAQYALQKVQEGRDSRTRHIDPYLDELEVALDEISGALTQMRKIRDFANKSEEVDVFAIFDEAVQMASHLLQREAVTVRREKNGSMRVVANPGALRYAFSNLLLNSVQAFQDGSSRRDRVITLVGTRAERELKLDLSDNGPGIRIGRGRIMKTDDIFLVGVTTKKNGTGYGLPFVRDVIQRLHRGSINVRPSERGVTFQIKLPIVRP